MSIKVKNISAVKSYLESIYPNTATKRDIIKKLNMNDCVFDRAIKTLRSRGLVQVAGKSGNSNLYKNVT